MRKVCAWCGLEMDPVEAGPPMAHAITHGICPDCRDRLLAEMGTPLEEFLDSLGVPVMVVSEDLQLEVANEAALALAGKDREHAMGRLGGEVFECVNANLPGGCGRTTRCSGCAIRGSVTYTFRTGEGRHRVPATLKAGPVGAVLEFDLFVTTEKAGDRVLLKLETA